MRWPWIISVVAALVVAFLGWQTIQMTRELRALRATAGRISEERAELSRDLQRAEAALSDAIDALKANGLQRRELTRKVRLSQSCYDPGRGPRIFTRPAAASPGTRVEFDGYCFVESEESLESAYGVFLIDDTGGCELVATADPFDVTVRKGGEVSGFFTVPEAGSCFQEERTMPLEPGRYSVGMGCHACGGMATFRVRS